MRILILVTIMLTSFSTLADNDDWGRNGGNYGAPAIGLPGIAVVPPKVIVSPPVIDYRGVHHKGHGKPYWNNGHKYYKHEGKHKHHSHGK